MNHAWGPLARRLRFQQLAVFEAVADAGSILAASRQLAITQPAVSKSIHELERHLGQALFERGRRGVVLTDFGRVFERHARALLAELRDLVVDLNAWQSGTVGQLVVGTLLSAASRLLPAAIERLRAAAPDIAVSVQVGANSVLFPALARGAIDVVVGLLPRQGPQEAGEAPGASLLHVPLHDESLAVVVDATHPLARRRRLRLAELSDADWIVPIADSPARGAVRALFRREGLGEPGRRIESVSILTNLGLLRTGRAIAAMPHSATRAFVDSGQWVALPLGPMPVFGQVGYTVRADRLERPVLRQFITALTESAASRAAGRSQLFQ